MGNTRQSITQALISLTPDLFDPENPKPLKLHINRELLLALREAGLRISKRRFSEYLAFHVDQIKYLEACAAKGSLRYDLSGNTERLSAEDRKYAKRRLKKLRTKNE